MDFFKLFFLFSWKYFHEEFLVVHLLHLNVTSSFTSYSINEVLHLVQKIFFIFKLTKWKTFSFFFIFRYIWVERDLCMEFSIFLLFTFLSLDFFDFIGNTTTKISLILRLFSSSCSMWFSQIVIVVVIVAGKLLWESFFSLLSACVLVLGRLSKFISSKVKLTEKVWSLMICEKKILSLKNIFRDCFLKFCNGVQIACLKLIRLKASENRLWEISLGRD